MGPGSSSDPASTPGDYEKSFWIIAAMTDLDNIWSKLLEDISYYRFWENCVPPFNNAQGRYSALSVDMTASGPGPYFLRKNHQQ